MIESLSSLIEQRAALERQIQAARNKAKSEAMTRVRQLMAEYNLTVADLASTTGKKGGALPGTKVAPKYRDPASGATWSGRGLKPKWLTAALTDGQKLETFAI
jgi:DNA-binding protein H-NS